MIDWLEYRWLAFVAVLLAVAGALLYVGTGLRFALLLAFDLAAGAYLVAMIWVMTTSDVDALRRHAVGIDAGRWSVLGLTILLSAAVLAALGVEIEAAEEVAIDQILLGAVSILVSWLLMNTIFALHYAHMYYQNGRGDGGGLVFPGNETPDYLDFLYFALVLGMTFQVSDVAIVDRRMRRVALLHAVVSFFLNVVVISLSVSTLAAVM